MRPGHNVFSRLNKWSCGMKARALIDGAPYGSETVKAIGEVFDQTSVRIKMIFGNDHDAVEAARIRLAEAILSVSTEGNTDVVKRLPELPPLRHEELPPPLRFMISVGARCRR